jgi:hypothetical protein
VTDVDENPRSSGPRRMSWAVVALLVVVAVLAGVLLAVARAERTTNGTGVAAPTAPSGSGSASVTSARNDALADYEVARKTGKPIYVLFHSLT